MFLDDSSVEKQLADSINCSLLMKLQVKIDELYEYIQISSMLTLLFMLFSPNLYWSTENSFTNLSKLFTADKEIV